MQTLSTALKARIPTYFLIAVAMVGSAAANVGDPPPGAIFDLATTNQHTGVLSGYQLFTTSFVADANATYVSFAFRERPRFFAFDDASVVEHNTSTNLLQAGDFEGLTPNIQGVQAPWSGWNQNGISFAGLVAAGPSTSCRPNSGGPISGGNFWCDGSVQQYDALYQLIATTPGKTYDVSFYLGDNSGRVPFNPEIDMLVYAGDQLPDGAHDVAPEPGSIAMLGTAVIGFGGLLRRRLML